MLEETNKALKILRDKNKIVAIQRAQKRAKITLYKKYFKWSLIFVLLFFVIFFPVTAGTILGTWIKSFFGTIYLIVFQ